MRKIKIVNKNKFVKSIVNLILFILIMIWLLSNKTYSNNEGKYKTEYVTKGETLWQIAQEEIKENQYFQNQDVRNVILEIKELNNMDTSDLSEGMQIKIPIY